LKGKEKKEGNGKAKNEEGHKIKNFKLTLNVYLLNKNVGLI
jgi:hypothetical protein